MKKLVVMLILVASTGWTLTSAEVASTLQGDIPGLGSAAAVEPGAVVVYAYSQVLDRDDLLQDGPDGLEIAIADASVLLWVDKMPQAFFAHPTAYILVSTSGTRVVEGQWWPVLNGRRILYGMANQPTLVSPFELGDVSSSTIDIHIYPYELAPGDELADGQDISAIMTANTFFAWVDMEPNAFFTHPTLYILVDASSRIIVYHGGWWPLLNGKRILFGDLPQASVAFPFNLM
jgi:hypothetical protein